MFLVKGNIHYLKSNILVVISLHSAEISNSYLPVTQYPEKAQVIGVPVVQTSYFSMDTSSCQQLKSFQAYLFAVVLRTVRDGPGSDSSFFISFLFDWMGDGR